MTKLMLSVIVKKAIHQEIVGIVLMDTFGMVKLSNAKVTSFNLRLF